LEAKEKEKQVDEKGKILKRKKVCISHIIMTSVSLCLCK
jgi:hypothetical protein